MEERIKNLLAMEYEPRIMIRDYGDFMSNVYDYDLLLRSFGYQVIFYTDIEAFRYFYETQVRGNAEKYAVIVSKDLYVPYDIREAFYQVRISLHALYPKMNSKILHCYHQDLELVDFFYDEYYGRDGDESDSHSFMAHRVLSKKSIERFLRYADGFLVKQAKIATTCDDWIRIAQRNAVYSYYSAAYGIKRDTTELNDLFQGFLQDGYQKLSAVPSKSYPAILPKTWDLIAADKVALIVMDGMSMFDYEVFSRNDWPFASEYYGSFAMIPTVTSISRQALIAGKYPSQLEDPFSLSKEEAVFYAEAVELGYSKNKAFYGRGYDADPGPFVKLATIIVNDIDDMVHGQLQGRQGMHNDVTLLAKTDKLQNLVRRLLACGMTVYITSDHGNTECIGTGSLKRTGVETETKSRRMLVLKDFGEASLDLRERTIQYPGYYMNKTYQYFICKGNTSFDPEGKQVMSHGGMTIDEVIVPFIKITGEKKNG